MSILTKPYMRVKQGINLQDSVLYAPLWSPDMAGATFVSKDPNHHLCTVIEAAWGIQGRTFDGSDDYIKCGTSSAFKPTTAISVGLWFLNDVSEVSTRLISMSGVDALQGWMLRATTNTIVFNIHDGTAYRGATSGTAAIGAWHFFMGTYDKVNMTAYLEGVLSGTPTAETDNISYSGSAELHIGTREGLAATEFFDGKIGEVWIYNRALSAAEILHIYQVTKWRYS